jgi:NAD(P)-dependent dehydrogenase (short-subunit alcohol dehydrogenase family)
MSVFDLSDRVAIVTGGTGGVGLALARGVQQAVVTAAARNRDKRRARLTQRRAFGVAAEFLVIDITERLSCDENYPGQI